MNSRTMGRLLLPTVLVLLTFGVTSAQADAVFQVENLSSNLASVETSRNLVLDTYREDVFRAEVKDANVEMNYVISSFGKNSGPDLFADRSIRDRNRVTLPGGEVVVVPEPASMLLLASGLVGGAGYLRKRYRVTK